MSIYTFMPYAETLTILNLRPLSKISKRNYIDINDKEKKVYIYIYIYIYMNELLWNNKKKL